MRWNPLRRSSRKLRSPSRFLSTYLIVSAYLAVRLRELYILRPLSRARYERVLGEGPCCAYLELHLALYLDYLACG